jgi:hypothetical protein
MYGLRAFKSNRLSFDRQFFAAQRSTQVCVLSYLLVCRLRRLFTLLPKPPRDLADNEFAFGLHRATVWHREIRLCRSARESPCNQSITTPLGIEATLTIVLTSSKLSEERVWFGFLWMVGIFIGTLAVVTLFAALKPQNLLFGKEEHLAPMLEPSALRHQIEDLIQGNVKPEALTAPKTKS